jgi:hypothetical protein
MLLRLINHPHAALENLVYDFVADRALDAEETKHVGTTLKIGLYVKLGAVFCAFSVEWKTPKKTAGDQRD